MKIDKTQTFEKILAWQMRFRKEGRMLANSIDLKSRQSGKIGKRLAEANCDSLACRYMTQSDFFIKALQEWRKTYKIASDLWREIHSNQDVEEYMRRFGHRIE